MVVKTMSTAIRLRNARHVTLDNVSIRGFQRGILAENSQVFMRRTNISGNFIGIETYNSDFIVANSILNNNLDILLGKNSEITILDTIARRIIDITKTPVEPVALDVNWIARRILSTKDVNQKMSLLKQIKEKISPYLIIGGQAVSWIVMIYELFKILQELGFHI